MKLIGRRLEVNWGTDVVVLEKLVCDPIERGLQAKCPSEPGAYSKLYDVFEYDGELYYKEIETNTSQYGADLNSLMTNGSNFLTKQEKETK